MPDFSLEPGPAGGSQLRKLLELLAVPTPVPDRTEEVGRRQGRLPGGGGLGWEEALSSDPVCGNGGIHQPSPSAAPPEQAPGLLSTTAEPHASLARHPSPSRWGPGGTGGPEHHQGLEMSLRAPGRMQEARDVSERRGWPEIARRVVTSRRGGAGRPHG